MDFDNDAFYVRKNGKPLAFGEFELDNKHLETLHKMTLRMLVTQGMFPEVRSNLERFKPEYFSDVIRQLIRLSVEYEHHEMTAYLLDYQYKHKLFNQTELRL